MKRMKTKHERVSVSFNACQWSQKFTEFE